jgi:hypothetical protein
MNYNPEYLPLNGIVSRDWEVLLMVWLDEKEIQSISGSHFFKIKI